MSRWIFVTGTPGMGKTTALREASAARNLPLVNEGMMTGDTAIPVQEMFTNTGRCVWITQRFVTFCRALLEDVAPNVRLFDRTPTCGFLFSRAVYAARGRHLSPFLAYEYIANLTLTVLAVNPAISVDVVVVVLTPGEDMALIVDRINRRQSFDANIYTPAKLQLINDTFVEFAACLARVNTHPHIRVITREVKADEFYSLGHLFE